MKNISKLDKSKKMILALVIVLLGVTILITPVNVSALTFKGKFNTGKIDASVAGAYSNTEINRILGHVKKWNNTSSNINITKSSKSYSNAKLRIRYKMSKPVHAGTLGLTKLYDKNKNELDGVSNTWFYATCIVYNNSNNTATGYDATLVHEVGHSLSLAHCIITSSHPNSLKHIIHQGVKSYTTISAYEKQQIQNKWGK